MRRVFVVFMLLAMMVGLKILKTEASGGADPLTLAAIGFVVLAAFALAELGARLSLPKVTGYILSGVVLGPYVIAILSHPVVEELKMFKELALGLIATTAGLELDLRALRRLARTLGATIGVKLVTGFVLVGGALFAYELATGTLGLPDTTTTIALALVFGALSLGTSPAIALAVQSETGAKGRLMEIVMGAAVVKDVFVVMALAIAVALSKALLGGGELGGDVLVHLGEEVGLSVLAGLVLGWILHAYLKWVKTEMLLFVAAMVLVTAEAVSQLKGVNVHLEFLLVFIVAGTWVRNFSPYEHDLLDPLQTISLPVFIVFFTNAGASIDLAATWALLPLALVLCTARAVGFFVAGRVGGAAGGEPDTVRRLAWLGYLPQAGVTLGLVGLAGAQLSDQSETINALGMAVVAVNLLVGPITLRMALQGAGEVAGTAADPSATGDADATADEAAELPDELEAPALRSLLGQLRDDLAEPWAHWRRDHLVPAAARWRKSLTTPDDGRATDHGAASVLRALDRVALDELGDRAEALRALLARQLEHLESLPTVVEVALEPRNAHAGEADGWRTRWSKRLTATGALLSGRRQHRRRRVPVRITARAVIEPAMARMAEESLHDWQRYEVECLETLERVAMRTSGW
ncbi:MAG: cation:proton antiporter, partial [Myxococcales bacterium]|nr:cation:proton antiporter [Myxococcales bacterium]